MKETRLIMGMPITVEIVGEERDVRDAMEQAFAYFVAVDERFSPYKPESELMWINRGQITPAAWSDEMREIMALAEETKERTDGAFDIKRPDGLLDPSGIVKGWAIRNVARLVGSLGHENFFIDAGGDIQTGGVNKDGGPWSVGIRDPFDRREIVKVIYPKGKGVATSGTYIRGEHIYDPHDPKRSLADQVSLTVIGPDVYEADRFATAAFAMGKEGILFVEKLNGFEGYMINRKGRATMTSGFEQFTKP